MKILIIGYGSIGKRHYEVLKGINEEFNIALVTKQTVENIKTYTALNEVKDIGLYDYFIISSITSSHFEQLDYLNKRVANKKILVEKPIFTDLKDEISTIKNRIYCGYNLRFHPLILELKQKLVNQKVLNVNVIAGQYLPDWRPERDYREIYSADSEKGGGVLNDLSHEIDYVQWLFGKIIVLKAINRKVSNLEINSDDYAGILGITENNVIVNITLEYLSKKAIRKIYLNTNNNTFELDLVDNAMTYYDDNLKLQKVRKEYNRNYTYSEMHSEILFGKTENAATYSDALEVLKTITEIRKADKEFYER